MGFHLPATGHDESGEYPGLPEFSIWGGYLGVPGDRRDWRQYGLREIYTPIFSVGLWLSWPLGVDRSERAWSADRSRFDQQSYFSARNEQRRRRSADRLVV